MVSKFGGNKLHFEKMEVFRQVSGSSGSMDQRLLSDVMLRM